MSEVLIIVVSYNAMNWARKCFDSIEASSVKADTIVIDNGSHDGTVAFLETQYPWVKLVRSNVNLGFGAANNIGLKAFLDGNYRYAYLLNQDAWLEKDTLSTLISAAGHYPEFGILSPVQKDAEGLLDKNFNRKCSKYLSEDEISAVPFVMAAHWLMTREAVIRTGAFSPVFKQYGEDDNYIDRLHWHGLKCGVVNHCTAVHDRASREYSKSARMRLKCVACTVRASRPGGKYLLRFASQLAMLAGMSIKNLSLIPLSQIPSFVRKYPFIKRMARESEHESAFMTSVPTNLQ